MHLYPSIKISQILHNVLALCVFTKIENLMQKHTHWVLGIVRHGQGACRAHFEQPRMKHASSAALGSNVCKLPPFHVPNYAKLVLLLGFPELRSPYSSLQKRQG
jgi:hypothetical protein